MNKTKGYCYQLSAIVILLSIFSSCNNSENIPFPESDLGYTQPVVTPLTFSPSKPLKWDTAKKGGITPVIKKFDIDALPAFPYDSTGFKPFSKPPEEVHFDFNKLPEKDFSLDKLVSHPLDFKTKALGPIPTTNAGEPVMQKGKPLAIYDLGQSQGMQARLIVSLYKDHTGLLWIGSTEGLFRYDGVKIKTFIQGSAADPAIIGITEDNNDNIWFIKGGSVGMIDLRKGNISYSDKIGFPGRAIAKMTRDEMGNIWVYNQLDSSVSIINPQSRTFKNLNAKAGFTALSDRQVLNIFQDSNKNIWIATNDGGADIIDLASGKIKYLRKSNGLSSDSLSAITGDNKGRIWLASPEGLDVVDAKQGTIQQYGRFQGFGRQFALDLLCDDKSRMWRASGQGIEVADIDNGKIRHFDQTNGLSGDVVTSVVQDNYKRVWVASTTGLNMIDQNAETVHPLGNTQIISLMEDGANNLFVATQNGLFIVNPQRTEMHLLDKAGGLSDNFVQSFWQKNGNMVVATDGGYNIIDPVNNTLTKVGKKEGLISDTVYAAFSANSGNIWLTGPNKGIFLLDSAKKLILHTDASGGLNDDAIFDIKQDKNGLIWLATQHSGIDILDPVDGSVKYLNNAPGLKDTCSRMMLEDKYGRMWIGTDKGIYVADMKKGSLTSITTKQGLSNNTVLSLLEYNGTVLAGTNNKINMITAPDPGDSANNWKISLLDKSQGLLKEEANSWSTDGVTHDGQYLWGDLGLTVINQIKASSDSVATYITGMNVMGQPQYFISGSEDSVYSGHSKFKWDSVSGPYNLPVNLSLPHNENYLQFQFAQANLSRPDTTFYTYVLEGIDKSWSTPGMNHYTENYLNLPPGKYTFKVSSKGIDGKWGKPTSV